MAQPTLTIVNFRLKAEELADAQSAALHTEIVDEVTRDGQRWISDTLVNGKSALRMMVISYLTEARHLEELQVALETAARSVRSRTY